MRTLRLTVQYDGTAYVGWQRQERGPSIQELLERAFEPIEGRAVAVAGAGRTDAGAHALAQVASVRIEHEIDCGSLRRALNARLPPDVVVVDVAEAAPEFHARFSATGKVYRYRIVNADLMSPFDQEYAWHVPQPLDLDAMNAATAPIVGTHDFAAFQASGGSIAPTERTIRRAAWVRTRPDAARLADDRGLPGWLVVFELEGSGFLRHMVRTIVGTVVEVGSGRRPVSAVADLLETRDRALAGPTAPARGLFLVRVVY